MSAYFVARTEDGELDGRIRVIYFRASLQIGKKRQLLHKGRKP